MFHLDIVICRCSAVKLGKHADILQSIAGKCRDHTCHGVEKCVFDGKRQKCVTACKL